MLKRTNRSLALSNSEPKIMSFHGLQWFVNFTFCFQSFVFDLDSKAILSKIVFGQMGSCKQQRLTFGRGKGRHEGSYNERIDYSRMSLAEKKNTMTKFPVPDNFLQWISVSFLYQTTSPKRKRTLSNFGTFTLVHGHFSFRTPLCQLMGTCARGKLCEESL